MTQQYRVVRLDGLDIYRVERWEEAEYVKSGFLYQGKLKVPAGWRPVKVRRFGYDGGMWEIEEFRSKEEACRSMERLKARAREAEARANNEWQAVTCGDE